MIGKLLSVQPIGADKLRVVWDDQHQATIDLASILRNYPSVAPLKDAAQFAQVRLSSDGWSVEWPSGVDFGAAQLRQIASL